MWVFAGSNVTEKFPEHWAKKIVAVFLDLLGLLHRE